jgi:deoxyribonuclease V
MVITEIPHHWLYPATLEEAANSQRQMAQQVVVEDAFNPVVERIVGTDASNAPRDPEKQMFAVCVSLNYPALKLVEFGHAQAVAPLPYIPGFLGFREAPALVEAFQNLKQKPDLILVDGHGISHPRRLGIASHLGVLLDCPTIGVAKSILVGKPEGEPGNIPGDSVPLVWKGETIGLVLRTRTNVLPVYISPGHRISMASAKEWVIRCLSGFKLPEPTRHAHKIANQVRRDSTQILA